MDAELLEVIKKTVAVSQNYAIDSDELEVEVRSKILELLAE